MFQQDCQVAAHFKSESKHLHETTALSMAKMSFPWLNKKLHLPLAVTSKVPCAFWAWWEYTGKGPRGNFQLSSTETSQIHQKKTNQG